MRVGTFLGIMWLAGTGLLRGADPVVLAFETGRMEGEIAAGGSYHGVTRLVDRKTGRSLLDARYAALNLFKLMTAGDVLGMPREMERNARSGADWVEIDWGVVRARYEVRENSVDLVVTVREEKGHEDYEVFLSSYFDGVMRPQVYLAPRPGKKEAPEWVMPTFHGVFKDTLLAFPRDAEAARICIDGRWEATEHSGPTVPISPVRRYANCLAVMRDPEAAAGAVLMADPRGCYAISSRYVSDGEGPRQTSYSAFDLMLLGEDVAPGVERSVRVRLAVSDLDADFSQALEMYEEFIEEGSP